MRHIPEAGAVCGNSARTDLCGGRGVTSVPTATDETAITGSRLWQVMRRFFATVAKLIEAESSALAEKLSCATPHWMRHTHTTQFLEGGAELVTIRDNLRHSSLATTSMYLHADDARRATQVANRFGARA